MSKNNFNRRGIAALAAGAMCGMALFGSAGAAFAQEASPIAVDGDAATTLDINKYLGSPIDGTSSDGTTLETAPDLPALSGVVFTAYEVVSYTDLDTGEIVPLDLTTNDGWAAIAGLDQQTVTQGEINDLAFVHEGVTYQLAERSSVTTEAGTATFTDLGVGFFLIQESDTTGAYTVDAEDNQVPVDGAVLGSQPFFVTLPMTTPSGTGAGVTWMYDVDVYPKNQAAAIDKAVIDLGTVAGHEDLNAAQYVITSGIAPAGDGPLDMYVVGDSLDPLVTFTGATVAVGETALEAGVHYDLVEEGQDVRIVFTQDGLDVLEEDRGGEVTTTLDVTFAADEDGETVIPNDAWFIPGAGWYEMTVGQDAPDPGTDPGDPGEWPGADPENPYEPPTSNEVESLYGQLNVTKVNGVDQTVLENAVFTLSFGTDSDGNGFCEAEAIGDTIAAGLTTDADGQFSYNGLQASFFQDGAPTDVAQGYCLTETAAPDGFNLLPESIYFEIDHTGEAGAWVVGPTDLTVANAPINLDNDLPLTGGQGAAMLGGLGILALGGAGGYLAYRSRQEKAAQVKA